MFLTLGFRLCILGNYVSGLGFAGRDILGFSDLDEDCPVFRVKVLRGVPTLPPSPPFGLG